MTRLHYVGVVPLATQPANLGARKSFVNRHCLNILNATQACLETFLAFFQCFVACQVCVCELILYWIVVDLRAVVPMPFPFTEYRNFCSKIVPHILLHLFLFVLQICHFASHFARRYLLNYSLNARGYMHIVSVPGRFVHYIATLLTIANQFPIHIRSSPCDLGHHMWD